MDKEILDKILDEHVSWLNNNQIGKRADLRGANLRRADLKDADLRSADLSNANLDFSSFPLWCGSFDIKDDGRLAKQLLGHIARLDVTDKKLSLWIEKIPKNYKNNICKRHDVDEV